MNVLQAFNALNLKQLSATKAEIKKAYKKAALLFHPDKNKAGASTMKIINSAYDYLNSLGADQIVIKNFNQKNNSLYDYGKEVNDAINKIIELNNINIEICGAWVWVSGNTMPHKEKLKEAHFKWAIDKKMWYFHPKNKSTKSRANYDMEKIRNTYGSELAAGNKQIAA